MIELKKETLISKLVISKEDETKVNHYKNLMHGLERDFNVTHSVKKEGQITFSVIAQPVDSEHIEEQIDTMHGSHAEILKAIDEWPEPKEKVEDTTGPVCDNDDDEPMIIGFMLVPIFA